jgi:hypothetical protein
LAGRRKGEFYGTKLKQPSPVGGDFAGFFWFLEGFGERGQIEVVADDGVGFGHFGFGFIDFHC